MQRDDTGLSPRRSDLLSVLLSLGFFVTAILQGAIPVVGAQLRSDLGLSSARVGLLMSAFLISYAVAQTPAGIIASRSAGKMVAAGFGCMALGSLVFAFASSYSWFFLARLIQGVGCGTMLPSAGVMMARHLPWNRLGRAWAIYGAAGSIGYLVLLLGMARIVEWGGIRPFFLAAAGITAAAGAATYAVGALVGPSRPAGDPPGLRKLSRDLNLLVRSRLITLLGLTNVAGIAVTVGVLTWTPTYLQDEFGASLSLAAALTAGFAGAQIIGAPLAAVLLARFGHVPLLVAVFAFVSSALLILPWLPDMGKTFVVVLVIGLGTSLAFAPSFSIIPLLVDVHLVGMAGGYLNAFGFVGALFAPWVFGWFLDVGLGYGAGYVMLAGFGLLGVASTVGLLLLVRRHPPRVGTVH